MSFVAYNQKPQHLLHAVFLNRYCLMKQQGLSMTEHWSFKKALKGDTEESGIIILILKKDREPIDGLNWSKGCNMREIINIIGSKRILPALMKMRRKEAAVNLEVPSLMYWNQHFCLYFYSKHSAPDCPSPLAAWWQCSTGNWMQGTRSDI